MVWLNGIVIVEPQPNIAQGRNATQAARESDYYSRNAAQSNAAQQYADIFGFGYQQQRAQREAEAQQREALKQMYISTLQREAMSKGLTGAAFAQYVENGLRQRGYY